MTGEGEEDVREEERHGEGQEGEEKGEGNLAPTFISKSRCLWCYE